MTEETSVNDARQAYEPGMVRYVLYISMFLAAMAALLLITWS